MARSKKSVEERMAEIQAKIEREKAQYRALAQQKSKEERKKRTRTLIQIGAEFESVLKDKLGTVTEDDIPIIREYLLEQENRGEFVSKYVINARKKKQEQEEKKEENGNAL